MGAYYLTDDQFVEQWNLLGSALKFSQKHQMSERSVYNRRRSIESRLNITLSAFNDQRLDPTKKIFETAGHARRGRALEKGHIIVFGDCHFWPEVSYTTAYKALIEMIKAFSPKAVICIGDAFDGSQASRHPRIGWQNTPTVKEELESCQEMMEGIEKVSKGAELIWTLGNHDARFETFLSNGGAQSYQGVQGFTLKDHFPLWKGCWTYWIENPGTMNTVFRHKWKGSWSGGRNNTLAAGTHVVSGHTHHLSAIQYNDYNTHGRWGVQTGCLADPRGEQFIHYTQDAPTDWTSGFALLTYEQGHLLQPELIRVFDENKGLVDFRGKLIHY
jgi:hypothetical protein